MSNAIITRPTFLQAQRESDGSLTVAVTPVLREGYISTADYYAAEMNGEIEIIMTEPLTTGYILINYTVN